MKILAILAAAALAIPAAASAAPAPAAAAASPAQVRVVVRTNDRHHRGYHRRGAWRQVCTTKWRHHRRVRSCHRVRYWR
jgi:hypothetical protein